MTLGERIRQARKSRNMSQYDLAAASGVERGTINLYEHDGVKRRPDKENLRLISDALGLDPNELYALAGYSHDKIKEPSPENMASYIDRVLDNMIPVYMDVKASEAIDYIGLSTKSRIPRGWKAYQLSGVSFPSNIPTQDTIIIDSSKTSYQDSDLVICTDEGQLDIQPYKNCKKDAIAVPGVVVGAIKKI